MLLLAMFADTVLSRASAHGCSQLKRQKVMVGGVLQLSSVKLMLVDC